MLGDYWRMMPHRTESFRLLQRWYYCAATWMYLLTEQKCCHSCCACLSVGGGGVTLILNPSCFLHHPGCRRSRRCWDSPHVTTCLPEWRRKQRDWRKCWFVFCSQVFMRNMSAAVEHRVTDEQSQSSRGSEQDCKRFHVLWWKAQKWNERDISHFSFFVSLLPFLQCKINIYW